MTEFRDAIAAWQLDWWLNQAEITTGWEGDAVLAMPEMKAIKAYIREDVDGAETAAEAREWLNSLLLPESVIDWVLGDDDE